MAATLLTLFRPRSARIGKIFATKSIAAAEPQPKKYLTTEKQSSQRSEYFLIKNSLLCALSASVVSHPETFVLLHQSGLLGDILNGLMFLVYLRDELLRRLVLLEYAEPGEL